MKQKILALLLVLALALSVAPMAAFAAESCPHTNTFTATDSETGETRTTCYACGENVTEPGGKSVDADEECDHPGYYSYNNATEHWFVCMDCGVEIDRGSHTLDDRGICTKCMYSATCPTMDDHDIGDDCVCTKCGAKIHVFSVEITEEQHREGCRCGEIQEDWENHVDKNSDTACDICGYGCEHIYAEFTYNQYGHDKWCPVCYKAVVEWTEHKAPCDICGYKPCADDNHTFGTEGREKQICQVCGYYVPCEDKNSDCICDICGGGTHLYTDTVSWNETQHWWFCSNCQKDVYYDYHYDDNKDGKCDVCGCSMENPGSGSGSVIVPPTEPVNPTPPATPEGLDNVPKTGDVSVLFFAALVALAAVLVPMRKRAR